MYTCALPGERVNETSYTHTTGQYLVLMYYVRGTMYKYICTYKFTPYISTSYIVHTFIRGTSYICISQNTKDPNNVCIFISLYIYTLPHPSHVVHTTARPSKLNHIGGGDTTPLPLNAPEKSTTRRHSDHNSYQNWAIRDHGETDYA